MQIGKIQTSTKVQTLNVDVTRIMPKLNTSNFNVEKQENIGNMINMANMPLTATSYNINS